MVTTTHSPKKVNKPMHEVTRQWFRMVCVCMSCKGEIHVVNGCRTENEQKYPIHQAKKVMAKMLRNGKLSKREPNHPAPRE